MTRGARRIFSFGLFIADMIYRQKRQSVLPDEFLGIQRSRGDNAMIIVPAEWIRQAKNALERRGVLIDTNFGGLANAMVSILAVLSSKEKIVLIAACGNDQPGRGNVAYLESMGIDTTALEQWMSQTKMSASNLIRNLQTDEVTEEGDIICHKDFAFHLEPIEGFPYSRWIPNDLGKGDIVHLGGMDLVLCPKYFDKDQKQDKYKRNVDEMIRVAREARQRGATVVADFCMGDPDFWEMVPDGFFSGVDIAKPGMTQALAVYNSRHPRRPIVMNVSDPHEWTKKHAADLSTIQGFLLELGFKAIFMTLDAGGTIIAAKRNSVFGKVPCRHIPIIPARRFVDGTGCGDAFVAGIIYGVCEGWDMLATARFSSAIGSLIAERVGVSLEKQYRGRGKWLPAVTARLKETTS